MDTFGYFAVCGDPTCACASQPDGVFDQEAPVIPELSEPGYEKLDSAIDDALEEANVRGFEEGFDEGFGVGYDAGVNAGAREALDNVVFAGGPSVSAPGSAPGSGLDGLIAELDAWAPGVDAVIANVNAWAPDVDGAIDELDGAVEDVNARVELLGQLVASILLTQADSLARVVALVNELQEKTDGDAFYLDSLGELFQSLAQRMDRVEDVTGARRVALS